MTGRRFALQPSKTPTLTGGDDQPRGACYGNWLPFWALIDAPRNKYARKECLKICNAVNDDGSWVCPLRDTCWTDNEDEEWVQALRNNLPPQRGCDIDGCDRPHNAHGLCAKHYKRARKAEGAA